MAACAIRRHLLKAQDFVDLTTLTGSGTFVNYPLNDGNAFNVQAALIWHASESASYYLNFSDRTRFPTIFERFSPASIPQRPIPASRRNAPPMWKWVPIRIWAR
jgi:hypothetical protein